MSLNDQTLWEFCRDKGFRYQLMSVAISQGLARQIRDMRAAKGWTQAELGRRCAMAQPMIARLEKSCESATIPTLLKIARAFDVGLSVRFESWDGFLRTLSDRSVPLSWADDLALAELRDTGETPT